MSVVINNAGIVSGASFLESDDWRNELTMRVNCNAHMWTAKAFLPDMIKEHDGHICRHVLGSLSGLKFLLSRLH